MPDEAMIESHVQMLDTARVQHVTLTQGGTPLTYADVLVRWQSEDTFRTLFLKLLANAPFDAYRWETPPVTTAALRRPFECVLVDSPGLDRRVDAQAFASYFTTTDDNDGVVSFENLGGDTLLIVPSPRGDHTAYGHLAAFTRHGPATQNHRLWQTVGAAMLERVSDQPTWLSTAGGGVSWLHVRLDPRPKYYRYRPYTTAP